MQTTKTNSLRVFSRALLSMFLMAAIMTAMGLASPTSHTKLGTDDSDLQPISRFRIDLKAFMKLSKDDDPQLQRNAIFNLCTLHDQIVRDVRFLQNRQLQGYRATIAKRLETYKHDLAKKDAKEKRAFKKSQNRSDRKSNKDDASSDKAANVFTDDLPGNDLDENENDSNGGYSGDEYSAGAESFYSMGQLSGGPSQMLNYVGGRFAPPWDHGPELVALIENTINPSSWRSNGGKNSIHYFQPLRVLVIGAPSKVQDDTLDLLMKLRRANGDQIQLGTGFNR